jgi:putative flippase GtrA
LARQFVRLLAAGGTAALANFGSRFLFSEFMAFEYAVVLAFFVGLGTGFILSRSYVFAPSQHAVHVEMTYYLFVNLLALLQTWLLSVYLAKILTPQLGQAMAQAVAHLAGIMLPVITSYFGHRYFTFKERRPNGKQ